MWSDSISISINKYHTICVKRRRGIPNIHVREWFLANIHKYANYNENSFAEIRELRVCAQASVEYENSGNGKFVGQIKV